MKEGEKNWAWKGGRRVGKERLASAKSNFPLIPPILSFILGEGLPIK